MSDYIPIPGSRVRDRAARPVEDHCDVLVCGGGPAGVTVAIAAARAGVDTLLVERGPCLGGMGTAALVPIWHTAPWLHQIEATRRRRGAAARAADTVWGAHSTVIGRRS